LSNENHFLVFDAINNVWKTSSDTPVYENSTTTGTISEDIEGQTRPTVSNPGADHFGLDSVRYTPLTPSDVGPYAYGDINTAINTIPKKNQTLLYPNPTNTNLHLKNLEDNSVRIEIIGLEGKILFSKSIEFKSKDQSISTAFLTNGFYFVRIHKTDGTTESQKIIVQH